MIQQVIYDKLSEVRRLLKENKVKRAYLFGSVCSNNFKEQSDVDFLVSFNDNLDPIEYGENYFKLLYALQNLLKRDVDIVAEETLSNPYLINSINKTKVLLYE